MADISYISVRVAATEEHIGDLAHKYDPNLTPVQSTPSGVQYATTTSFMDELYVIGLIGPSSGPSTVTLFASGPHPRRVKAVVNQVAEMLDLDTHASSQRAAQFASFFPHSVVVDDRSVH